jgi:oligopeptide transport system ATP-binding protein
LFWLVKGGFCFAQFASAFRQRVRNTQPDGGLIGEGKSPSSNSMALLCRPKLLIADEPTTALDVTVQAQIMTLLNELKREFNTAIIMITHDLGVVAGICDQVMVMYAGRTMEYGTAEQIFYHPTHPYSIGLMDAIPRLDGNEEHLVTIPGNPPNLLHLPKGCPFSPRCQFATEQCQTAPKLTTFNHGQLRNCWLPVEKFTL